MLRTSNITDNSGSHKYHCKKDAEDCTHVAKTLQITLQSSMQLLKTHNIASHKYWDHTEPDHTNIEITLNRIENTMKWITATLKWILKILNTRCRWSHKYCQHTVNIKVCLLEMMHWSHRKLLLIGSDCISFRYTSVQNTMYHRDLLWWNIWRSH